MSIKETVHQAVLDGLVLHAKTIEAGPVHIVYTTDLIDNADDLLLLDLAALRAIATEATDKLVEDRLAVSFCNPGKYKIVPVSFPDQRDGKPED